MRTGSPCASAREPPEAFLVAGREMPCGGDPEREFRERRRPIARFGAGDPGDSALRDAAAVGGDSAFGAGADAVRLTADPVRLRCG